MKGRLRIHLGSAPGVGTTHHALEEARRRAERGTDVVVGAVHTHHRTETSALLRGLETVPPHGSGSVDTAAVITRGPELVVVDDLARPNGAGSPNPTRWQDVEELLAAGIDVLSTVGIHQLESLYDVVHRITGVYTEHTVPDRVVRAAAEIELVDVTPQELRRRMAHGDLHPAERVDAELADYYREGNLAALRELALLWTADRVEEGLARYRGEHQIRDTWAARERVVVALTGGPEGETLIRRAARVADRSSGGRPQPSDLVAVHVVPPSGRGERPSGDLLLQRRLLAELGGTYHQVVGTDVPSALLEFARGANATQIVLGSSRRRTWQYVFGPGVGTIVARESGDIDVHIVTHEEVGGGRWLLPAPGRGLNEHRRVWGWTLALMAPPLVTLILALPFFAEIGPAADPLFLLLITVATAAVGGLRPAVASALWSAVLLTVLLSPLHGRPSMSSDNFLSMAVFVLVGSLVAVMVEMAARRSAQAVRARAEADAVALLASSVLAGNEPLQALLRRIRETFGQRSATLLERVDDGGWHPVHSVGAPSCESPEDADALVTVSDSIVLALRGRVLPAADRGVLAAFATHVGITLEHRKLAWDVAEARAQAAGNRIRTALLAAVSHDLRTPLTSIKASVSSLRATDIELSAEDRAELLETVEESTDRLDRLIGNLLDMSRVQTDSVVPRIRAVDLHEVLPATLLGVPGDAVLVDVPDDLPRVRVDAGLLDRAVANVVTNAVRYNPLPGTPVLVSASAHGDSVQLRVVDRGPGVSDEAKQRMFEAFQRLGDAPQGTGVGLGLAVARGFVEAMHGDLNAEDTPGGGLTMVFTLRAAAPEDEEDERRADAGPGR
ncbi:ATP-binding protein [Nocardiopsis sp. MG754419]|uniref:ATP-binding protein n=1 Tax=Nocardiopsis sp. MG754419 TaxID=2259865 RepID=UPI001BA44370|nr:ATP-binding protein [Nocardiopsis sp. MG754419]MBR8743611.1 sensor histidine kinase [Nocardiopsis sp. MG754419]